LTSGAHTQAWAGRNPYFGFNAFPTRSTPGAADASCAACCAWLWSSCSGNPNAERDHDEAQYSLVRFHRSLLFRIRIARTRAMYMQALCQIAQLSLNQWLA